MSSDERDEGPCTATPALSSTALIAAADGEADEAILAHLRACPHCAARVADLRALQARLRKRLYRLHCPSSDVLVDYCQGLLDPFQRAAVTHHLGICPHCAAELALLERGAPLSDLAALGAFGHLGVPLT